MINSVLETIGKKTTQSFLKKFWKSTKYGNRVELVLHICRRHVQKAILRKFIEIYKPGKSKEFHIMLQHFKKWIFGYLNVSDLESFHRRVLEIIILTSTRRNVKGIKNILQNLGELTDHTRMLLEI